MTTATATPTGEQLKGILDKIARLKNLAEQPGTPEEGVAALHAIGKLMTRYNLSERQVSTAGLDDEQGYIKTEYDLGSVAGWRKTVFFAVAEYMFCSAVVNSSGRGAYFIGKEANITVAANLYEYLCDAILRIADEGWAGMDPFEKAYEKPRTWKNAFRVGAAVTMRRRLRDQRREHIAEQQAEAAGTSALVVVQEQELKDAVAKFFPRLGKSRGPSAGSASGLNAGRRAAHKISLADQLAG